MASENDAAQSIAAGEAVLGVELGSTRIKAQLIGTNNQPIASGSFEWENQLVDGYWSYALEDVRHGLAACYASLKTDVRERYGVTLTRFAALGISAMMHGYLAFDARDRLLVPFRTWRNTNATQAGQRLSELFGFHVPERWSVSELYQAVLDGESHVGRIAHLATLSGYVHWLLTGERVLSVGDASGMFPIDSATCSYDAGMLAAFDALPEVEGLPWKLGELLPRVLVAGQEAGRLTPEGALLLDPEGDLEPGCPLCPPEGDGGTGMLATNAVRPRTGNVSAGTSIFSMVVLDRELADRRDPNIDLVCTPAGDPVAMVHCNNCTSDINAWVGLLCEFADLMGVPVDCGEAFTRLFEASIAAPRDAGGLVSLPFVSAETIVGVSQGVPALLRVGNGRLELASLMQASVMSAFASLAIGNEALAREGVRIERLCAHGGIFKTPKVAQRMLAAALGASVTVMETSGEGGAWGQALAAAYLVRGGGLSLADWLDQQVFSAAKSLTLEPAEEDVEGFAAYRRRFEAALGVERRAGELFARG